MAIYSGCVSACESVSVSVSVCVRANDYEAKRKMNVHSANVGATNAAWFRKSQKHTDWNTPAERKK